MGLEEEAVSLVEGNPLDYGNIHLTTTFYNVKSVKIDVVSRFVLALLAGKSLRKHI